MERISQSELISLFALSTYGPPVLFFISDLTQAAGYTGWLCLIIGWIVGLGLAFIAIKLASFKPDDFITHFGRQLVGRWLHVAFMVIFFYYFMHEGASILRELRDFILQ